MSALDDPETSVERAAELIGRDEVMAARTLRPIDSAFFGMSRRVATVRQAAALLGIHAVKYLALSTQ